MTQPNQLAPAVPFPGDRRGAAREEYDARAAAARSRIDAALAAGDDGAVARVVREILQTCTDGVWELVRLVVFGGARDGQSHIRVPFAIGLAAIRAGDLDLAACMGRDLLPQRDSLDDDGRPYGAHLLALAYAGSPDDAGHFLALAVAGYRELGHATPADLRDLAEQLKRARVRGRVRQVRRSLDLGVQMPWSAIQLHVVNATPGAVRVLVHGRYVGRLTAADLGLQRARGKDPVRAWMWLCAAAGDWTSAVAKLHGSRRGDNTDARRTYIKRLNEALAAGLGLKDGPFLYRQREHKWDLLCSGLTLVDPLPPRGSCVRRDSPDPRERRDSGGEASLD